MCELNVVQIGNGDADKALYFCIARQSTISASAAALQAIDSSRTRSRFPHEQR